MTHRVRVAISGAWACDYRGRRSGGRLDVDGAIEIAQCPRGQLTEQTLIPLQLGSISHTPEIVEAPEPSELEDARLPWEGVLPEDCVAKPNA